MESPVRICIGAASVVSLLLLTSTVNANTLPTETINNAIRRDNNTAWTRNKPKLPDVALNELHPKDSTSEEHSEKNAKYKDRGRVKFNLSKTTPSTLKITEPSPDVIIVTPTPEVKKPAQIISSMHTYKKTKMPAVTVLSTSGPSIKTNIQSDEEFNEDDEEDEEEEDDKESYEKYTSPKFDENSFFGIPNFDDEDEFRGSHHGHNGRKNVKDEYSTPSFEGFSSYFPQGVYSTMEESSYNSETFFDFDSELTTPKNDFFDKKYNKVSSSIIDHVIHPHSLEPNTTHGSEETKYNTSSDEIQNNTPANKSTVFIKNTKEIRFLENDKSDPDEKGISDAQGTSVYYEMTVLSTETYKKFKDKDEDDCDNDTQIKSTKSTPIKEELASIKAKSPNKIEKSIKKNILDSQPSPVSISTVATNFYPTSTVHSVLGTLSPVPISTQNTVFSTQSNKLFSNAYNSRSRNYSKRLNLSGAKNSPNSVFSTVQTEQATVNQNNRPQTRRFHFTTPKTKPIWMAPRRNITRTIPRAPTTIYSEYFDIKDKIINTSKPISPKDQKEPSKATLTTQSSDIDPVLQSDVSGVKKVVQSQSIADNTIPSLWKRGSTKFSSSTPASVERNTGIDLEIPPTLTAWALASMRSPPSLSTNVVNTTTSTQKNIDENELQKVGEALDIKEMTTTSTTTMITIATPNDVLSKNITEISQNRLPWKPVASTISNSVIEVVKKPESISERVPAESNISIQSSPEPANTETEKTSEVTTKTSDETETESSWVPVTTTDHDRIGDNTNETPQNEIIQPVAATNSTGFESITKLPAGITTPKDDTVASSEVKNQTRELNQPTVPTTDNYDITTIRFSYVPREDLNTETISTDVTDWIPVTPTRTRPTIPDDTPVTTYRPKYMTTTEKLEETTIMIIDSTPQIEVSSQIIEKTTRKEVPTTTESVHDQDIKDSPTIHDVSPAESTTENLNPSTTESTTTPMETTTIIVSVATEINSERAPMTTNIPETTETVIVEKEKDNEIITQDHKPTEAANITTELYSVYSTTVQTKSSAHISVAPTTASTTTIKNISTVRITTPTTVKIETMETTETTELPESTTDYVEMTTKSVNDLEDLTSYGDVTTEASLRTLEDEAGSGAAIAIAVSTIGVIALVLLVGLLLVVRRRGRRGVYAQRCTPVSLDAYSLDSVSVGHRKGNHRLRASKRSYGNPAYDDEVTSHPMQYSALANFALDIDSITAEFSEIPSVTVRPDEVPPGCEDKNRYSNVLPLPETRVPLGRLGGDPTTEYINANYIAGPGNIRNYYIAAQAPLVNTVIDFWRMIWEQNSRLIVMLTEYMEGGVEKCYEYLPPSEISDNKRTFGEYQIILKKREQKDKYAVSSIQVINLSTRTWREVIHIWYFWPAKGLPDDFDSFIDFLSEMRNYMKITQTAKEYDEEGVEVIYQDQSRSSYHNLSKLREENGSSNGMNVYSPAKAEEMMKRAPNNGTLSRLKAASEIEGIRPCTVVCASGAGRSAAVIAAELCARALAAGQVDVPRVVRKLRDQRPHSLSNRHHYIFLYRFLSEYGNKLLGGGVDNI